MVEISSFFFSLLTSLTLLYLFLLIEVGSSSNLVLPPNRVFLQRNETTLRSQMVQSSVFPRLNERGRPVASGSSHIWRYEVKSRYLGQQSFDFDKGTVVILDNSTILSQNRSFELGFFTVDGGLSWYVGIWYASIPIQTYVWVANRENPVKNHASAKVRLTANGRLEIIDSGLTVWQTENMEAAVEVKLLDTGNLVLLSHKGEIVWESFDFPTDTWLPGMNITSHQWITCWRSALDPSPGNYSLRLKQSDYGVDQPQQSFARAFKTHVRKW